MQQYWVQVPWYGTYNLKMIDLQQTENNLLHK